jgi:signal transduction histidine kinase
MLGSSSVSPPVKTGYTIVPPLSFHINGKLAGFTVDAFNEASRREGMTLAWIPAGPSLKIETSLTAGSLDIVPAGMVTPERQQKFYVSAPWWFAELSLMTKEGAQGGPGKSIGLGSPIYRAVADKAFPGVPQVPFGDALQAASALCQGEVDSALLTHMDVHRLFLYHPREADSCRVAGVHVIETRAVVELAVVARRDMEAAAQRLRRRIDEMALDGTLARLAARYPDIPSSGVVKLANDLRVRYAGQHLREVVIFSAILVLVAAFFVHRLLREVRAQRRAQARLTRAHRIASLGDWEFDLATGRVDFSDAARELFCFTASAPRTGFDAFLHCAASEDVDRVRAALDRAAAGNVVELDYAVNAGARGRHHIRQRAEPVCSHDRVVALVGTIQDITDYKELEAQFRQAQRLESIGRLAGGIAHDFNNLLTVINGYTAILLKQLSEYEPSHEAAREIQKAGNRAAALTRQLLTFSRRQEFEPADIDLNNIVLDSEKMLGRLVGDDVSITTVLVPEAAPVHADSGAISQMLTNFVVNARDAMPDGGRIRIETQNVILDADTANHMGLAAGPHVLLTISDTGCGMDSATVSRIFEPFFTTKAKGRGTGLGLSTVYGIVRQCNGTLEVQSEVGQGTTFRVYFPRAADTVVESNPSERQSASLRGSERILIVEDEPALRRLIAATLRSSGYETVEAANAGEALQALSQEVQPDLVVTDVSMPGMSGIDLARRIIADHPGFRVLLISGYVDSSENVLHSGFPMLGKPFTPSSLTAHVRALLDGTGLPEHKRSAGW